MPYKEKETVKLYYSIGEVAEILNTTSSMLRFWEKEFDIIKPSKNKKGTRMFTDTDIENFKLIYSLLKVKGYTIEGARKHLKQPVAKETQKPSSDPGLIQSLKNAKELLLNLRKQLDQ